MQMNELSLSLNSIWLLDWLQHLLQRARCVARVHRLMQSRLHGACRPCCLGRDTHIASLWLLTDHNPVLMVVHREAWRPAGFALYHILLLFQRDARPGPFYEVLQDWV